MGFAYITAEIGGGRYTIEIDAGAALQTALETAASARVVQLEAKLVIAEARVIDADNAEAAAQVELDAAIAAYVADPVAGKAPLSSVMGFITLLQVRHAPIRLARDAVKFELSEARRLFTRVSTIGATLTRDAWCVDYTVDTAPGTMVATVDIPGDSNLVLIAPGCRPATNADGFLTARGLLAPHQAYLLAALFPGWQKWSPTYRWGTITSVNLDANTVDVDLFAQTSSAQRLGVNQASSLAGVEVEYMDCGSRVFEVDDRVVVQFVGQEWSAPRVIGFLDNPRPCDWPCINVFGSQYYFESKITSVMDLIFGGSATFEVKLNGGSWVALSDRVAPTSSELHKEYLFDNGVSPAPSGVVWVDVYRTTPATNPASVGYGMPPCIAITLSPGPPLPPRFGVRNIAEVRIVVAAVAIFNAAIRDMGFAGEDQSTGYAKATGGIGLINYPNNDSFPVLTLEYTLTGNTT